MPIKNFSIEYDSINSKNIFTNGDTITGRIIVEASKETLIQSLTFIGKGRAKVSWYEYYSQYDHRFYWSDEEYYEIKQCILRHGKESVGKGRNVFPFSFMVPNRNLSMIAPIKNSQSLVLEVLRWMFTQKGWDTNKVKLSKSKWQLIISHPVP
ncbi:arrestin domain-containing protein 3-like [Phycodurus eques]|uniref:arrestin domain-containing protein 3-like n=1 Tax=Phycodurus eques TaxID=693459 RepID=UPI002ACD247E|nr:arrestin domain-containing protein 3-like [Phycodurus eques]